MFKRMLFVMLMVMIGLGSAFAYSDRDDDYKVIQNAVKKQQAEASPQEGKVACLRIEVTENGQNKVRIRIPLSIVEILVGASQDEFHAGSNYHINMKKVLDDLKKAGPMAMIEIEENDSNVKIWVE